METLDGVKKIAVEACLKYTDAIEEIRQLKSRNAELEAAVERLKRWLKETTEDSFQKITSVENENMDLHKEVTRYKSNIDTTEAATGMCGIYAKLELEVARLRKIISDALAIQKRNYGRGMQLHLEMIDWAVENKALEASDGV